MEYMKANTQPPISPINLASTRQEWRPDTKPGGRRDALPDPRETRIP
jgi:hypothetical protein